MDLLKPLSELHLDMLQGGMTVDTPAAPAKPILRTIIQFDGDIQNIIFCSANDLDAAIPGNVVEAHLAAMRKCIDRFSVWQKGATVTGQAARGLTVTGWLATILVAFYGHLSISGMALDVVVSGFPAGIRYAAPWMMNALLNRAASKAAAEREKENKCELGRLRVRRAGERPSDMNTSKNGHRLTYHPG